MKKFWGFLTIVFLLLGITVRAQNTLKNAPETKDWREFTATDGSFKILFPKPPQTNTPFDLPGSKFFVSTVSPTEKYLVEFKDYPAPLIDEMERLARLEPYVPSPPMPKNLPMPTIPSAKNSSPTASDPWDIKKVLKVVRGPNYSGVEFEIEPKRENITKTVRMFIVKQREFSLVVTTPLLKKLLPAERQSYQKKIDAFFNSFIVGDIPAAKYAAIPLLPEDLGSVLQGNEYLNKHFGFKINLPPNWKADRLHQAKEGKCAENDINGKLLDAYGLSNCWRRKNNPTLVSVVKESKKPDNEATGLTIEARRPNSPEDSLEEFVEQQKFIAQDDDEKPLPPDQIVKINGQELLMCEVKESKVDDDDSESEQPPLKKRMYFMNRNGVFLIFSLKYRDEADEKLMMESMKTLTFLDSTR